MANTKKKHSGWFAVGLLVYVLVALIGIFFGLRWFRNYLQAYEDAQMYHSIGGFMEQLDTEDMYVALDALLAKTDARLQVRQDCIDLIDQAVSGGVTCARNRKLSTDTKVVYMLLSGEKTIGQVTLETTEPDAYGHVGWRVAESSFDFEFLLKDLHNTSLTVPDTYTVTVNGVALDESYITQSGMQYAELKEFYEDYDLPCRVTYTTGYVLGTLDVAITDENGNPVTQEQADNDAWVLDNCTQDEKTRLEAFMTQYLQQYVRFMSSNIDNRDSRYQELLKLIAKDSFLRTRMKASLDGLQWNDFTHSIQSITINGFYRINQELYLCDVSYVGLSVGETKLGSIRDESVNHMKMIVTANGDSFLAEASASY